MDFLNKLLYSLHPFPPSLHQLRLHILQPLPPPRCRLMLPQHMAHTQRLNQSPFSSCPFPQNEVRLNRKIPIFLYIPELCSASDRPIAFEEQGQGYARNCSHPLPSPCTALPRVGLPRSQRAACTTGAQKDSFLFHIFMTCHGNHGRQELRRKRKKSNMCNFCKINFFSG